MRNREVVEYLVYPRFFNAHSVLYKGTYCVSFALHHSTRSKTATPAFPFLLPASLPLSPALKEPPALHEENNFSFLTHKFDIVYEQEWKKIDSQCIFRLQFDLNKNYQIFLVVKLLRRSTSQRGQEEAGLCVRRSVGRMETIDEQVLELKKEGFHTHERVVFRASEFFSSVDLYLCSFGYGYKHYRSKLQLANLLTGVELAQTSPAARLRERIEERKSNNDEQAMEAELLRDYEVGLPGYYYELLNILAEYKRIVTEYDTLLRSVARDQDRAEVSNTTFVDLEFIRMRNPKVNVGSLAEHFEATTPKQVLGHIFEQKELLRKHIRLVRQQFCKLLLLQSDKRFSAMIAAQVEATELAQLQLFVRHVDEGGLCALSGQEQARRGAVQEFTGGRCVWNSKVRSVPCLYVEGHREDRTSWQKQNTLTVFVHGYQGNSFDFQKAKNYLRRHNKHTHVLIVESITKDMNESIDSLGRRVAEEVTAFINGSLFHFTLINFVGFSLGGLIARAAFPLLQSYWGRFNLFATFSSPHLGISECENSLVNIGVWYLIKVDKVKNLKELNFQSVKFGDSLLARLSLCPALGHFRKVVLVCSKNDGFVPYYSTVLDPRNCDKQNLKELCANITAQIRQLERVELVFDVENSGTFDRLTGRKGHIEFLDNDYFLDMFFRIYGPAM